jgi:hypothetical protein
LGPASTTGEKVLAASRLRPGDLLLCYLVWRSTFVAVLEVTGASFLDQTSIWSDGLFPVRLPVRMRAELSPLAGLPVHLLVGKLSFLPGPGMPNNWTVHVRSSPRRWKAQDARAVVRELEARISRSVAPLGQYRVACGVRPALRAFTSLARCERTPKPRNLQRPSGAGPCGPRSACPSFDGYGLVLLVGLAFFKTTLYGFHDAK